MSIYEPIEINGNSKELKRGFAEFKPYEFQVGATERQTIDIISRLNESNKLFVLDIVKLIEQKQLAEKEARNAAYLDKIERSIQQAKDGRGFIRDIIEVDEDE